MNQGKENDMVDALCLCLDQISACQVTIGARLLHIEGLLDTLSSEIVNNKQVVPSIASRMHAAQTVNEALLTVAAINNKQLKDMIDRLLSQSQEPTRNA